MLWWKFAKILMSFSKPQGSFSSNFTWLFSVVKDNSSILFQVKDYILCTKWTNQSANVGDFWVLGSKFTKFLSILKQQIGFCSHFVSIFSIMRHNSSVLFFNWNCTYFQQKEPTKVQIWWNSPEQLKFSSNFALWWAPFVKIILSFCQESTEELSLMTLRSDAKFKENWHVVSNMTWRIWWIFQSISGLS